MAQSQCVCLRRRSSNRCMHWRGFSRELPVWQLWQEFGSRAALHELGHLHQQDIPDTRRHHFPLGCADVRCLQPSKFRFAERGGSWRTRRLHSGTLWDARKHYLTSDWIARCRPWRGQFSAHDRIPRPNRVLRRRIARSARPGQSQCSANLIDALSPSGVRGELWMETLLRLYS